MVGSAATLMSLDVVLETSQMFYDNDIDPDEMISINSEGVDDLAGLRSQICRIPKKDNPNGLIQIMSKKDMKTLGIDSPNESDSVMQSLFSPKAAATFDLEFDSLWDE